MKNIKKLLAVITLFAVLNMPILTLAEEADISSDESQSITSSETDTSDSSDTQSKQTDTSSDESESISGKTSSDTQSNNEADAQINESTAQEVPNTTESTPYSYSQRAGRTQRISSEFEDYDTSQTIAGNTLWNNTLNNTLSFACDWLSSYDRGNLYFFCMGVSGKSASSSDVTKYIVHSSELETNDIIDIEYAVLNTTFCGYDATDLYGTNLVREIYEYDGFQNEGIKVLVYALLSLDSNGYKIGDIASVSRDELCEYILNRQNDDGGFCEKENMQSDVISTALAVTALSGYKNDAEISRAISKAITYLSAVQQADAGFIINENESLEACADVIVALYSLGLSANDERFVKNDYTLIDELLNYTNADGGFCLFEGELSSAQATESAVLALNSIKKASSVYTMSNELVGKDTADAIENVINTVKGHKKAAVLILVIVVLVIAAIVGVILTLMKKKRLKKPSESDEASEDDIEVYDTNDE